jgi:cell division protein FtsQ
MPSRIALPQPHAARLPRPPHVPWRAVAGALAAVALLFGGWLWLRDSSLVRVSNVHVTGAKGFGGGAVRSALEAAAGDMTTLNVDESALRAAVARYPLVRDVQASAHPPHRLDIRVIERVPVGVIHADGTTVAVTDDGILLRGVPTGSLPQISASVPPGGARVGDRKTAAKVAVLASAPAVLRSRVTSVSLGRYGLQARLRSGLVLRFGDGQRLRAKWIAAQRVMSDPGAADATYIDLRIPARPAAGGLTEIQGGAPAPLAAVATDPAYAATTDPAAATTTPPATTTPATTDQTATTPAVDPAATTTP